MATFRRGLQAEDRICTKLEGFGCRIQRDPKLDHKHKIDFVITNYIDNPNFYSLGVQITTKLDQLDKQEEFLRANQASRVTTKALYLELSDRIDLEDGGALAILAVILDFQFNRSFANVKLTAVRIYDDLTYQFYDLAARVKQLRQRADEQTWKQELTGGSPTTRDKFPGDSRTSEPASPMPAAPPPGARPVPPRGEAGLQGVIDSYVRQGGHGIIQGVGDDRFFFHISHVQDEVLRDQLNGLPYSTAPVHVNITVDFDNAGFTKPGARYPEARGVIWRK